MRSLLFILAAVLWFSEPAQAQLQPGEGFIAVPGGRVWYRVVGSGPKTPLLVLHGGPGASACYLEGLSQLSDERAVIFYDQLGAGRSDRPLDTSLWRLDRFVTELAIVRSTLGLQQVHILGHSWGGALAAEYLLNHQPLGVRSVTFASPLISTPRWIADVTRLRSLLPDFVQRSLLRHEQAGTTSSDEYQSAAQVFYDRFVYRHQPRPVEADCAGSASGYSVYLTMWGPNEFQVTGNLRDFDRSARLGELRLPTLFLAGRYDEATPETIADFRGRVPGAEMVVFEDSAHMAMQDQTAQFTSAVRSFLRRAEGEPATFDPRPPWDR